MKITTGAPSVTGATSGATTHALPLSPPETRVVIGWSGTYTGATMVAEYRLSGGSIWYPLRITDRKTGVVSNGSVALTDSTTYSFSADARGASDVRVYASAGTLTAVVTEVESGTLADFGGNDPIVSLTATTAASFAAGITLTGGTGANVVAIPDNLADALSVSEGATAYLTFVTTDASEAINLKKNTTLAGTLALTSASASALAAGRQGATNPALQVDASTATCLTGLKVKAAGTGAGLALSVVESGGTNNKLTVDAMGSGQIELGSTSTGVVVMGRGALKAPVMGLTKTDVNTQNAAPTAAQWLGGYITHNSQTGAGTLTTPTGANITAAYTGAATGDSFLVVYQNRGNQTVTLTAGDGNVTLKGTVAIPTLKTALVLFNCTGANTWDACQILGA